MDVGAGAVRLTDVSRFVSGTTLVTGRWTVASGATLDLVGATIRTNSADITLHGPSAGMASLSGLTTNNGQLKLLEGRLFTAADTATSERVAIVSRRLAARLWPGGRAVGQRIRQTRAGEP